MAHTRAEIRTPLPTDGRVHRVGKVRAGVKKAGSKDGRAFEYPSAVDHFVVNADAATSQQSADSFHEVYGPTPRELRITLPGDAPEDVLDSAWRMYGTGGMLKRKCAGPGMECKERGPGGEWIFGPCACAREGVDVEDKTRHCQPRWTLNFLLMDVVGVGVWQFDTGSPMAGDGMASMLQLLYTLRGTLLRAECVLRLVPVQVAPKGQAKTVFIARLEAADVTPQQALDLAAGDPIGQLPPSTLDDGPDELLDGAALDPGPPPKSPPPVAVPLPEPDAQQVATVPNATTMLKGLSLANRADLYRLAGIQKGTRGEIVSGLLAASWGEMKLPDYGKGEPDLNVLLNALRAREREKTAKDGAEEFQRFADTGEDTSPGGQTTLAGEGMYGSGAPA